MAKTKKAKPQSAWSIARYAKRCRAVDAVREGETPVAVARILGVPLRTLFHWLARYRPGGYGVLKEGQRSGRPRKGSGEVMQWLYEAITLGDPRQYQFALCLWTLGIICQLLRREFGIELSKRAVSGRGDTKFASFEGRMTAERFVEFIKKLHHDSQGPIMVIADNASYHTAGSVERYVAQTQGEVVIDYLPRSSPEFNPDEQVWNHAKARLAKLFLATKAEFKAATHRILLSIQRSANLVRSFFQLPDTKYAAA
jgi:transposase